MRIKEKEQKMKNLKLYQIDEMRERVIFDTVYKYVVDKATFKKYFPNWNDDDKSKPKLKPKRKKA